MPLQREMGAGAALAVDEAHALGGDILQGVDAERIAARTEQALIAPDEVDHALRARFEPWFIFAQDFAAERTLRNMKARQFAAVLAKCHYAFEAADKADVELRAGTRA